MDFIAHMSGIFAAICALCLIIYPTTKVGLDYKTEPLSKVCRSKWCGKTFQLGLILTGLFLILFTLTHELTPLGQVIYLASCVSMIISGIISEQINNNLHTAATRLYFGSSVIAQIVISIAHSSVIGILLSCVGGIGTMILYFGIGWKSHSEYWGIIFSVLWMLTFYFM